MTDDFIGDDGANVFENRQAVCEYGIVVEHDIAAGASAVAVAVIQNVAEGVFERATSSGALNDVAELVVNGLAFGQAIHFDSGPYAIGDVVGGKIVSGVDVGNVAAAVGVNYTDSSRWWAELDRVSGKSLRHCHANSALLR